MLYTAGWYADYVGVSVHFVRRCRSDQAAHEAAVDYIVAVPRCFGSLLAKERVLVNSFSADADADDEGALAEFEDSALASRWSCGFKPDSERLEIAWRDWEASREGQSPLAVRARSIALSKDLPIALREREAEIYLRIVLNDVGSLDQHTSARL